MNWFVIKLIDWLKAKYLEPLVRSLKAEVAVVYLEGIRGARRILILFCLMIFFVTMIGAGLVLIPLSLLELTTDAHKKAIIGAAIGAVYLLVPLVGAAFVLSEKRWLSITGAQKTVDKLLE